MITADIHDRVDAGNESFNHNQVQLLNGAANGVVGSVLTIPVGPGDKVSAEVYAKYLAPTGTNNPAAAIGNLVLGAITGSTGVNTYEGAINNGYGSSGTVTNLINANASSTEPMAFINLLFLPDDATDHIDASHFAFKQVSAASSNSHAILALDEPYEAPESGYVVVYLSNESTQLTEVYFDDLKVTVNEHPVIQRDDYYPFGHTFNSYQRITAERNDFLFNGIERERELDLGWDLAHFRAYDPLIGRWLQIDPKASERESPYVGFGNRPNFYIDPLGDTVRLLTADDPRNDGATYIADEVVVSVEQEVPAERSHSGDFADAFDIRPIQVVFIGDGPLGDDSNLPPSDPNAKTLTVETEVLDALGALGSSKLKGSKAAKNSTGKTGGTNVNDVTKDVFGKNAHNGTKRGIQEIIGASKGDPLTVPDSVPVIATDRNVRGPGMFVNKKGEIYYDEGVDAGDTLKWRQINKKK